MLPACIPSLLSTKREKCLWLFMCLVFINDSMAQSSRRSKKIVSEVKYPATKIDINEHLRIFDDSTVNASYFISVCADVPNNKKPLQVAYHQETGHVFIILQKIKEEGDTISRVFGFYPKTGLQTLLFKKTRSVIKDNSDREYDVIITRQLSREEFDTAIKKSIVLAGRKYHMNRYNCYDYALLIFNSVAGESSLPITHIRFPFIFGKGGSPCSVYKEFKKMKESGSPWNDRILFGDFKAPISTGRDKVSASKSPESQ